MQTANPYQTPEGDLSQTDDQPAEVQIFSPSGRIGRLRYLAYGTAMALVSYAVMGVAIFLLGASPGAGDGAAGGFMMANGLISIVALVFAFIWAIKRLHDLDKSGWLSVLMIVPLVNLILVLFLLFARGTPGGNRYGPPPVANTTGVKILAFMFPVLMVVGIAAAILIPAMVQP